MTNDTLQNKKTEMKVEFQSLKIHMRKWKTEMPAEIREGKREKVSPSKKKSKKTQSLPPLQTPIEWTLNRIISMRSAYGPVFPHISHIAEVVLTLPASNAWPERGASKVKIIKTRLRSSLKNDMLRANMVVQINGPDFGTKECDAIIATAISRSEKDRRKKNKYKNTSKAPAASCIPTFTTETSTQTELDELDEPSQIVLDENLAAVQKIFGVNDCDDCDYFSDSGNEDSADEFSDDDFLKE